jgi:acyl-coenzyme A synthetase/AMP-(fatty) acid ligase
MSGESMRDPSNEQLSRALLCLHHASAEVAFGSAGSRSKADLLLDASRLARTLPEASEDSQVLMVFRHDRYAFAVGLLAAWQRGHRVALPPNTQRDSIWRVADQSQTVEILHDTESGEGLSVLSALQKAPPLALAGDGYQLPVSLRDAPLLIAYTSGTTERPRPYRKLASQLLAEAIVLRDTFGLHRARVVGTVPPGHIYGLLFTVLVPLCAGGAFLRETLLFPEPIADRVASHAATVLVTVPAHLRGFGVLQRDALSSLDRVFSSTAPLSESTARDFQGSQSRRVTEVFGSTETGGIAWRQRDYHSSERHYPANNAAWQPLPGVAICADAEGHLLVKSPFVDREPGSDAAYRTEDLVALADDGSFEHRGRADGVVKIGGKRVSIPAMEATLRALDGVTDVAIVAVSNPTDRGKTLLAAVCGEVVDSDRLRGALGQIVRSVDAAAAVPRAFTAAA